MEITVILDDAAQPFGLRLHWWPGDSRIRGRSASRSNPEYGGLMPPK